MTERSRTSDASSGLEMPVGLAIAVLGALAVAAGTFGRSKRRLAATSADQSDLAAYLREHLSGADAAIQVVEYLRRTAPDAVERELFESLHKQFRFDRDVVEAVLVSLGASPRSIKRMAGQASGSVLKMMAGGHHGELSLFRTLEALAVGIQAKRCMWRALQVSFPDLQVPGPRFVELEASALRQWEAVEEHRLSLVLSTFDVNAPFPTPRFSSRGPAH